MYAYTTFHDDSKLFIWTLKIKDIILYIYKSLKYQFPWSSPGVAFKVWSDFFTSFFFFSLSLRIHDNIARSMRSTSVYSHFVTWHFSLPYNPGLSEKKNKIKPRKKNTSRYQQKKVKAKLVEVVEIQGTGRTNRLME